MDEKAKQDKVSQPDPTLAFLFLTYCICTILIDIIDRWFKNPQPFLLFCLQLNNSCYITLGASAKKFMQVIYDL
jgi:hypothetical protein